MAKLSLADLLGGSIAQINSNFTLIKNIINNKILFRDNPAGEPNQMLTTLDMNSNRVINLPAPASDYEPLRRIDAQGPIGDTAAAVASAAAAAASASSANTAALAAQAALTTGAASIAQLATSIGSSLVGFIQLGTGAVARTTQSKLRDRVNPRDFGAVLDGVSDDTLGIQRAINFIQSTYSGGIVEFPSGCSVKLLSGLAIDTNKCGINWSGATVDCTGFPANTAVYTISQSAGDVNRRPGLNRAHPLKGAIYIGPGKTTNCTIANIQDLSASQVIAGVQFQDGGCWGWATGFTLGQGCFFTSFTNFDFAAVVGQDMGTCVSIPTAINSGEKNEFTNCRFGQADAYLVQGNGNADTHFNNVSFNYAPRMMTITSGSVYVNGYHVEGNSDTDYWFYLSGSNSVLSFAHGPFVVSGGKTLKEVIYCDASVTHGGVILDDYGLNDNSTYTLALVGGTGRVQASKMTNYAFGDQPVTSAALNALAYGDFENANYAGDWVFSGTTLPTRTSTTAHSGTYSLQFAGVVGQNNKATATRACKPGQMVAVDLWCAATGFTSGGNMFGQWAFLDASGTVMLTGGPLNVSSSQTFTRLNFGTIGPAPAGTASFQLALSFLNVTAGTPFGYIDDVVINII